MRRDRGPELYDSPRSVWKDVFWIALAVAGMVGLLWFAGCTLVEAKECRVKIDRHERYVSRRVKKQVFKEAGIAWEQRKGFVVDHRIPLRLGGSNDRQNLQLQSKEDGVRKDIVEGFLHRCVCRGETGLEEAQRLVKRWARVDPRGACP